MPISLGIHGTKVAVDWDACVADGACMDVCPVSLYEWELNPGQMGTGNDKDISKDKSLYAKYRASPTRSGSHDLVAGSSLVS